MQCTAYSATGCSLCCCYANSDLPCRFIRQHHMFTCPARACWWHGRLSEREQALNCSPYGRNAGLLKQFLLFKVLSNYCVKWQHLVRDEQSQQRDAERNTLIPCLSSACAQPSQRTKAISHLYTKGRLTEYSGKQVAGYPTTCVFGLQSNENVAHKYHSSPSFKVSF